MQIPFLAWLLQGIPETIASVALIMVISTGKLPWKTIVKIGLIQAVTAYFVRMYPFTFGVHSIVLLTSMGIYLTWLAQIKFPIAIIASFITAIILMTTELIVYYGFTQIGGVSYNEIMNSSVWLRIIISYPQVLLVAGLSWLLYRRKYSINRFFNNVTRDW